jgi:hypothetical protein
MAPDAKLDVDQIRTVMLQEVVKRDVIEGEKAEDARKKVSRSHKTRRAKPAVEECPDSVDGSAAPQHPVSSLQFHTPS